MASSARLLDDGSQLEGVATPTPVLELPAKQPLPEQNRRFSPRIARTFLARIHGGTTLEGVDLSVGGMMCLCEDPVWPGNTLDFDLLFQGDPKPVPARGRVVELVTYRGRIAMRVRFDNLTMQRRKRIAIWMSRS